MAGCEDCTLEYDVEESPCDDCRFAVDYIPLSDHEADAPDNSLE